MKKQAMEQYTYDILYQIEETHWWFVGRRHIILEQIGRFYHDQTGLDLLDIGCGTGIFMSSLKQYGHVIGLDLSPDALSFCKQRDSLCLVRGNGFSLPFTEKSFDFVTANDLLEHLDDDITSLREWLRVLKQGGRAFVFVPAYQFLWSLQDKISYHKRRYTLKQLSERIERAGFVLEWISYANMLLFPIIFAGRQALKLLQLVKDVKTENTLHPRWTNGLLTRIFCTEAFLLRRVRFPFGVSIMAVCRKP